MGIEEKSQEYIATQGVLKEKEILHEQKDVLSRDQQLSLLQKYEGEEESIKKLLSTLSQLSFSSQYDQDVLFQKIGEICSQEKETTGTLEYLQDNIGLLRASIEKSIVKTKSDEKEKNSVEDKNNSVKVSLIKNQYNSPEIEKYKLSSKEKSDLKNNSLPLKAETKKVVDKLTQAKDTKSLSEEDYDFLIEATLTIQKLSTSRSWEELTPEEKSFVEQTVSTYAEMGIQIDLSNLFNEVSNETLTSASPDISASLSDLMSEKGGPLLSQNADVSAYITGKNMQDLSPGEMEEKLNAYNLKPQDLTNHIGQFYREELQKDIQVVLSNPSNQLNPEFSQLFSANGSIEAIHPKRSQLDETQQAKLKLISQKFQEKYQNLLTKKLLSENEQAIKEKSLSSCVQALGKFFDQTNQNFENFANDLSLNLQEGVSFQNGMLTLTGTMDGKKVTFRYDTKTGQVSASDFIMIKEGVCTIDQPDNFRPLPISLPPLSERESSYENQLTDDLPDMLNEKKSGDSRKESLSSLSIHSSDKLSDGFSQTVVEHTMQKNLLLQQSHSFLKDLFPSFQTLSSSEHSQLFHLYQTLDETARWHTSDELREMRNETDKLFTYIHNAKYLSPTLNFPDPLLQEIFKTEENGKAVDQGKNIFSFFDALSTHDEKSSLLKLSTIKEINLRLQAQEPLTMVVSSESFSKFARERAEESEKRDLEDSLESSLSKVSE